MVSTLLKDKVNDISNLNFVHLINIKVRDDGVKASVKIVQKIHNLRKRQESTNFNQYEEVRTTTHLQGGAMH